MKLKILTILLCCTFSTSYAETYFYGEINNNYSSFLDIENLLSSSITDQANLSFTIGNETDTYSITITPKIAFSYINQTIEFQQLEYSLIIALSDFLSIEAGRYKYLPGTAELFSNTNFYTTTDYEKIFSGNFNNSIIPNNLIQFKLFWEQWYLYLNMAPLPQKPVIPKGNSPWFPTKNLPLSITITEPINETLYLDRLIIENSVTDNILENINFGFEIGAGLNLFDLSVSYFHGQNNFPLYLSTMDFPEGLFKNYDIILTPVQENLNIFGVNFKSNFDAFTFWIDSTFFPWKPYQSYKLGTKIFTTSLTHSPTLDYTCGIAYEFYNPHINIMLEYKNNMNFQSDEEMVKSDLSSMLASVISFYAPDDKVIFYPTAILSTADLSWAIIFNFSFLPEYFFDCYFTLPLFFGSEKTDFGQYKNNTYCHIGFSYRY